MDIGPLLRLLSWAGERRWSKTIRDRIALKLLKATAWSLGVVALHCQPDREWKVRDAS